MIVIIWNVRGINDSLKIKEVVKCLKANKVDIACLLETRVKQTKLQCILDKNFARWCCYSNYDVAVNGRIWFLYKNHVTVNFVHSFDQSITCCIGKDDNPFVLSAIYGRNTRVDRRRSWSDLIRISSNIQVPWLIIGDFNVIARSEESSNLNQVVIADMLEFNDCLNSLSVFDHAYTGPLFTWSNHQDDGYLARKLDRALINGIWNTVFPQSIVEFLAPNPSDHSPILVKLKQ
ncbi:hypothetical protein PTKIN_Ptkin16aG0506600 [Pterospermum kingtungense]